MLPPVFVKGHLTFSIDGKNLEFLHQNISTYGVTSLPWAPLSSQEHFGKMVHANILVPSAESIKISAPARITREVTQYASHMGLHFELRPDQQALMRDYIRKFGYFPTDYIRKYPRIPSDDAIQTYPLRALFISETLDQRVTHHAKFPLALDVANLSPNGVLLVTENQLALGIEPNQRLDLVLEPRGWFPMRVRTQGVVCRVSDEINVKNGNLIRYLGIKFTTMDDVNRAAFVDLLRDIIERIKHVYPNAAAKPTPEG